MTREEAQNLLNNSRPKGNNAYSIMLNEAFNMAIKALKQMPVTTTAGEGGVIYYPQVEGVTPTVIDVGKQEPCEMTAEEYRQRMIQAFHNADTDELIAVCVLPTEKEFEHLEWLLKNHYKNEPCGNAIDRSEAIKVASGYCHPANVAKELAKLPPVNPTKTGHWIEHPEIETSAPEYLMFYECSECGDRQCFCKSDIHKKRFCSNCGCRMVKPQESEE